MIYRRAAPRDYPALGQIMYDAVRQAHSPYTVAQRKAWMPEPRQGALWRARLSPQYIIMAEDKTGPQGFMSLTPEGYVDFAYIRTTARGQGVFRALYENIVAEAGRLGLTHLSTHASLMAQPAFSKMGFSIVQKEAVTMNGHDFERFEMRQTLV